MIPGKSDQGGHRVLIKSADEKSKRLALLEDLQKSPLLDRRQRDWLRDEQFRLKRGIAGERDAAHFLDNYLRDDPDRMLLHDLRFQVDGEVVQIDHLIITRSLYVFLLETKNFNGNLRINEHGEFSVEYSGERVFGIPSPLEQSRRHEGPLRKLFERLEICGRNGGAPQIEHCVLVSPSSLIHRPPAKAFDTSNVIKADGFRAWHEKFQQNTSFTPGRFVGALMNIRGADTIEEFARKLVRQHRPSDPLALPEFMKPRVEAGPLCRRLSRRGGSLWRPCRRRHLHRRRPCRLRTLRPSAANSFVRPAAPRFRLLKAGFAGTTRRGLVGCSIAGSIRGWALRCSSVVCRRPLQTDMSRSHD